MAASLQDLRQKFPRLKAGNCRFSSPEDPKYNCIAWAAGEDAIWWEPDPMYSYHWPVTVPRVYTVPAYIEALGTKGYVPCDNHKKERGVAKIALYALNNLPKHASRQLDDGWWGSKLGTDVDIEHTFSALDGGAYGNVIQVLCKRV